MAVPTPPRSLKTGAIIDKTLAVIERSVRPIAIYLVALTLVNGAIGYFAIGRTDPLDLLVIWIAGTAAGIAAGYLLLDAVIRGLGLEERGGKDVFFAFVGLSVVITLGFIAGLILLVIPGLIVMARWSFAAPLLVARATGIKEALAESWERTRGAEIAILVAALALLILPIAVIIVSGQLFEQGNLIGLGISTLATTATSVITTTMGVAIYGMIAGSPAQAFE